MNPAEYAAFDATALAAIVARREASCDEIAAAAAAAAERVNPRVNAVVEILEERIEQSEGAKSSSRGALYGVPFLLKDIGTTEAGVLCEGGSRLAAGYRARQDSAMTLRFHQAGLVNLGRTATSEAAIVAATDTVMCGATRNPWDATRSAAGSSGGAAAAVAAGIVPIAHGTDGGGSLRMPAACCGVVGFKPSRGRVLGPRDNLSFGDLVVEFAVTRTVRDTALLLDAVRNRPTEHNPLMPEPTRSFSDGLEAPVGRRRIGVIRSHLWGGRLDREVEQALNMAVDLCNDLGHDVIETTPTLDWRRFVDALIVIWPPLTAAWVDDMSRATGREPTPDTLESLTLAMYERGKATGAGDVLVALEALAGASHQMLSLFGDIDVLLTPTLPVVPPLLGVYRPLEEQSPESYYNGPVGNLESHTAIFNCSGQPAISLPLAQSDEAVPIGMQFVGRPGHDQLLLQLAGQLEEARPWSGRIPRIHATRSLAAK